MASVPHGTLSVEEEGSVEVEEEEVIIISSEDDSESPCNSPQCKIMKRFVRTEISCIFINSLVGLVSTIE